MFRKFNPDQEITKKETAKAAYARKIRTDLAEQYPALKENLEQFFPKKDPISIYKTKDHTQFLCVNGEIYFFGDRDGPFLPTLRLLHKYPEMMTQVQVDRGAIPFVLKGAPIMAAGITSPGGRLPDDLEEGEPVAVMCEGKENAAAVGLTAMSSADMKAVHGKKGAGAGILNMHQIGDGLWNNYKVHI